MKILRNRFFSEKDKKGLSSYDKLNIASTKLEGTKKYRRLRADIFGEDEEKAEAAMKEEGKRAAVGGAVMGAGAGAVVGHFSKGKAGKGAAIGAVVGAPAMYLLDSGRNKLIRSARKNNKTYRKIADKGSDYYRVGAGDMTEQEFAKKWGNKK